MFNFFSSTTPDGVAIVAAFMMGVTALVFGVAAWHGITNAVKDFLNPPGQMAKRNRN